MKTNSDHHFKTTDPNWIQDAKIKKGALHTELGVKQGKKIPLVKVEKAAKSNDPLLKKRAQFALNVRKK